MTMNPCWVFIILDASKHLAEEQTVFSHTVDVFIDPIIMYYWWIVKDTF